MKKKDVAEWLIKNNGACTMVEYISCEDCPLDYDTKFMNECHPTIGCGGMPGLSSDESSVVLAKEYLEWKAKKKEKKPAEEPTDPRIGTIWEWTGTDGGIWKNGDRAKLISITPAGLGVFDGRSRTWSLNTSLLVQVDDTKKEEPWVAFVPGMVYKYNETIVVCTSVTGVSDTTFSAIPLRIYGGGSVPEFVKESSMEAWNKRLFKPCKIEVKVIE